MKKEETFWSWLRAVRLSRLVAVLVPCLVVAPLLTYWILTSVLESAARENLDSSDTARKVLGLADFDHLTGPDLKARIEELLRIKSSVQTELRNLEKKRQVMLQDLSELTRKIESLKSQSGKELKELERLRLSIQQTKLLQQELMERNTPEIRAPRPLVPSASLRRELPVPPGQEVDCTWDTCLDFSRCSVSSQFPVYVYKIHNREEEDAAVLYRQLVAAVQQAGRLVEDPDHACIYLVPLPSSTATIATLIKSLPTQLSHWQGDGRNHILFRDPTTTTVETSGGSVLSRALLPGRYMIAQSSFSRSSYCRGFDLVLPSVGLPSSGPVWADYPAMVPIVRKYLLYYHGEQNVGAAAAAVAAPTALDSLKEDAVVVEELRKLQRTSGGTSDKFLLRFKCDDNEQSKKEGSSVDFTDWRLCGEAESRLTEQQEATFSLILPASDHHGLASTLLMQRRLYEALKAGSVPVVLGQQAELLPLAEVLDWTRLAVIMPRARITELHFLLRSLPHTDIFAMKRQGRLVYESYLSSPGRVLESLLAVVRGRLLIPPPPIPDTPARSVFNSSFTPLLLDELPPDLEPEENLGSLEAPAPSPAYRRNYSTPLLLTDEMWNSRFSPFRLAPHTPWEPVLPTEAKFRGSGTGFRPICGGEGGSGKEFSEALGGNIPQEQFTVVMLTYEREAVLISSLARLHGLPYLNRVVVVWNSPSPPAEDLRWPDIGVPIEVVRGEKNSLNNRFLPFSSIETEAILSVDDDSHLRHDEIIFGFRVWREQRDRIVGFPGRFHGWDSNETAWHYNSNYSCELSMVLTGAAFFHKYYSYLYSYTMPQEIRDLVDELMNCEDLAMNFLVSHITRQPPVKVTSRWTFRCPGCPVSLSEDDSHFQERHRCINFFSRVYGYNPLLYTQFRADSVLFKTRIPPDKQKCFKFI